MVYKPPCGEPDRLMSQVQTTCRANRATGLFCVPTKAWCLHSGAVGLKLITLCNGKKQGSNCAHRHRRATSCYLTARANQPRRATVAAGASEFVGRWVRLIRWPTGELKWGWAQFSCSLETRRECLSDCVWLLYFEIAVVKCCHISRNTSFHCFPDNRHVPTACTQHEVTREGHPNLHSPTNSCAALSHRFFPPNSCKVKSL